MRRPADLAVLTCPLTLREREAADEVKAKLGINSDANLVRTAVYGLAAHCEANIDTGLFRLRGRSRTKRVVWNRTKKAIA